MTKKEDSRISNLIGRRLFWIGTEVCIETLLRVGALDVNRFERFI